MEQATKTQHLIIGSGMAGLSIAIKLAEEKPEHQITIVTKSLINESNTKYAQGGIAVVLDSITDSYSNHIKDTLIAGDNLCNKTVVERVIKEGPKYFKSLLDWGVQFDLDPSGDFNLGKEGGHSKNRVAHHKDITGAEIERALIEKVRSLKNVDILEHHFAIDLIVMNNSCYGTSVFNKKTKAIEYIVSQNTILATGGIGQIYGHTTNPSVATGDGIAIASRAGAKIVNMEFIQFHPTAFYSDKNESSFLISEAVRGFGAYLKNSQGERFMFQIDKRGELASRDIVSKGIYNNLQKTKDDCVYLDCTHLDIDAFKLHFPNIHQHCITEGINIEIDWIPVVPASHYLCGGIDVNPNGQTSISNLFACGECSHTGLHGANRLASNSLLEALVYAHHIFDTIKTLPVVSLEFYKVNPKTPPFHFTLDLIQIRAHKMEIQKLMRNHVGIVRQSKDLLKAKEQLEILKEKIDFTYTHSEFHIELAELKNCIATAYIIVNQSIKRNINKGGFYNQDLDNSMPNLPYPSYK